MQDKEIQELLKKVEELKRVFAFGVDLVPFLEELLAFVQDVSSTLNEMDKSARESSGKTPTVGEEAGQTTRPAPQPLLQHPN